MAEPPAKRRRTNLTFEQKNEIILYKDSKKDATQSDISVHFSNIWNIKIGRSTVSDILKNKETITNSPKSKRVRHRSGKHEDLENALFMWFNDMRSKNAMISDEMLICKAKIFGQHFEIEENFQYSKGWVQRFKQRHGLKSYKAHGEAGSVDLSLVNTGSIFIVFIVFDNYTK